MIKPKETAKRTRIKQKINIEKYLVSTDVNGYEMAKKNHLEYQNSFEKLLIELGKFKAVNEDEKVRARFDAIRFAKSHILDSYEVQNTMKLSYKKLIEVLEIDVSKLEAAAIYFDSLNPHFKEIPKLKDFETFATEPSQIVRFKALNNLIQAISDLEPTEGDYNIQCLKSSLMQALNGRLISSQENIWEPIPSTHYVMKGRVYG